MSKVFKKGVLVCPKAANSASKRAKEALERAGMCVDGPLELDSVGRGLEGRDVDAVVLLGTDRDIIRAIHRLGDVDVRFLALSLPGHIGFFASATLDDYATIERIVSEGEYVEERYMRLRATTDGRGEVYAFNEVAIFPSRSATTMEYALVVDGEFMWRDVADGLLVATPMGSTAYSLSVGGPVVMLGTEALLVLPVNSVDISRRPMVIPSSAKVEIREVVSKYRCELIADGIQRAPFRESAEVVQDRYVTLLKAKELKRDTERLAKKQKLAQEIASMPPSAKFVTRVLEELGQASVLEIAQNTALPLRTVRHALRVLVALGLVNRTRDFKDARKNVYKLNPDYSR